MSTVFFFLFFCVLAIVLVSTALGLNFLETQRKKQVKSMLRAVDGRASEQADTHILFEPEDSQALVARTVSRLDWAQGVETTLHQSGMNWSVGRLLALTLAAAAV